MIRTAAITLFLAQFNLPTAFAQLSNRGEQDEPVLFGKGFAACDDELPTLSVASENLINSLAEWDDFQAKNPFFVVGAADSTCDKCCDSEGLLQDLQHAVKDKKLLSYPEKNSKKKKIVRKEIRIARVDLANK